MALRILEKAIIDASDSSDEDEMLAEYMTRKRHKVVPQLQRRGVTDFSEEEFFSLSRIQKRDFERLCAAQQIPDEIRTQRRDNFTGPDALFITLRRLVYPCRLVDLSELFGRSEAAISSCLDSMVQLLYEKWAHLLKFANSRFNAANLRVFAAAIAAAGSPINRCIGFIDGTLRPTCRPIRMQRAIYNGHKRVHGLKFQAVMTPDGIISHLSGPYTGNRHDCAVWVMSGLLDDMTARLRDEKGPFCLYGVAGYPNRPQLLCPFKGASLTAEQQAFNTAMSKLRICVEWGFGNVLTNFAFLDYKKNQKLLLQPVGTYYLVATLLQNCRVCLYGSQTSELFALEPPSLEEYLIK